MELAGLSMSIRLFTVRQETGTRGANGFWRHQFTAVCQNSRYVNVSHASSCHVP
jgi:hypothetical protein